MSARPSKLGGREASTFTLAPSTVEALARHADETGESRGKFIDRLVAAATTGHLAQAIQELETVRKPYHASNEKESEAHHRAIGGLSGCLYHLARIAGRDDLAERALGIAGK